MSDYILVCPRPDSAAPRRLSAVLRQALADCPPASTVSTPAQLADCRGRRLLFALQLDEAGLNPGYFRLLAWLRTVPDCLEGCLGAVVVDSPSELYSKAVARELVLAANRSGCAFIGRSLVEATGSLANFDVRAANAGVDNHAAYHAAVLDLARRLIAQPRLSTPAPHLMVVHASMRRTSNTLDLWSAVREALPRARFSEYCLRNGTLADCAGCPYDTCLHYGEQGSCFYGGIMVEEIYPALLQADGLVLLCPNYNDAISANLTAFVNRLTALFRVNSFADKQLFALVVSGYSGGDLVARQLISALNMNKGFYLPPRFALMETANNKGAALRLPGIRDRLALYSQSMAQALDTPYQPVLSLPKGDHSS